MILTRGLGFPSAIVTRGLGAFDLLNLFGGSVTGYPVSTEILGNLLTQLERLDAEIDAINRLDKTVEVTELVGVPVAEALMVGVDSREAALSASAGVAALQGVGTPDETMGAASVNVEALGASQSSSPTLDTQPDSTSDMMGTDDTETGVA